MKNSSGKANGKREKAFESCVKHGNLVEFLRSKEDSTRLVEDVKKSLDVIFEAIERYSIHNIRGEGLTISYNGGKDSVVMLYLVYYAFVSPEKEEQKREWGVCVSREEGDEENGQRGKTDSIMEALYFEEKDGFQELDDFVYQSGKMFGLHLYTSKQSFREGLTAFLEVNKQLKGIFMGVRETDPSGKYVSHFTATDVDRGWPEIMRVSPIYHWDYVSIWKFLRWLDLPYCCLYDMGYTSIGKMTDTKPNPKLYDADSDTYLPAYSLVDFASERMGRTSLLSPRSES